VQVQPRGPYRENDFGRPRASDQYRRWDRDDSPSTGGQPTLLIYGGLLLISTEYLSGNWCSTRVLPHDDRIEGDTAGKSGKIIGELSENIDPYVMAVRTSWYPVAEKLTPDPEYVTYFPTSDSALQNDRPIFEETGHCGI